MNNSNVSRSLFLATGLMLFALFFGAGNLIFPAQMGQQAGSNGMAAALGLIITGSGLPMLGVVAIGYAKVADVQKLAERYNIVFAVCFASLLYLSIGPFFAVPRTATVSFEMGVQPLLEYANIVHNETEIKIALAIFSVVFFLLTLWFCLSPGKLIDRIGKILTPAMLLCILGLIAATLISPPGAVQPPVDPFDQRPFVQGFLTGYETMDGLASLVFAIIVINALRDAGVKETKTIMRYTIGAGVVAAICLGLIYVAVVYMGMTSVQSFGEMSGTRILAAVANHYWGVWGNILLFVIVLLACLSTAIGLITANAEYFSRLIPKVPYKAFVVIFTVVSAVIANYGLQGIISLSLPVLYLLYPLAIVLIALAFLHKLFGGRRVVYVTTLSLTLIVGILNGWQEGPGLDKSLLAFLNKNLPLYDVGLGWIVPAAVGFVLGLLLIPVFPQRTADMVDRDKKAVQ